jgi:rare lipoprotein A
LKYLISNSIFITIIFILSGCAFYNPFVPPSGSIPDFNEPISCEPISSDPMYRATMKPYTVMGKRYCPTVVKVGDKFKGTASWYGDNFHGRQTSNGEYYNMHDHTAAHKTLPINTLVKVTNLRNNRSTTVRINDRGPFVDNRIIDLSYQAAIDIDMIKKGTAPVLLEVVEFDESANKYAHKQAVVIADKQPKKSVWKRFNPENEQKVVSGGEYSIQIASLSNKERATALKEKCYNGNGNYNSHIKEKIYNGQTIYKVMLSGFKSIKEAKDFISKAHYQGAFVIRN